MEEAFKKLWSAVLQQALRDAQGNYYSYREEAREWLLSENHETASFLWVCDVLSLDPDLFRNAYRQEWKTRGYCKPVKKNQSSGSYGRLLNIKNMENRTDEKEFSRKHY